MSKKTVSIKAVPIFKAGVWKDEKYTIDDLDEIVKNTNILIATHLHEPPVKLGHSETQKLVQSDGYPAAGYVERLYRLGDEIFADLRDVPKKIAELIQNRAYSKVSSEIYRDFEHPETKEKIGLVLRAIALLGADIPEVKGLGDIIGLYNTEQAVNYIIFSEKDLKEEIEMRTEWTIKEVKQYFPCCVEAVQKYMEEHKVETINTSKLAEIITQVRLSKLQEEEQQQIQEQPKCPEGYVWDEEKKQCVEQPVLIPVPEELRDLLGDTIDENKLFEFLKILQSALLEDKTSKFALPGGEPRGWTKESFVQAFEALGGTFTSCMKKVADEPTITDPEKFCAWMKYKATGKWPGTKEWRATEEEPKEENKEKPKENIEPKQEQENKEYKENKDAEIQELLDKVKMLEKEKREKMFKELIEANRGVFLPRFDEYINTFIEHIDSEKVVKFSDKEISLIDLFYKFLKDIANSKTVIFEEIAKTPKSDEKIEVTDEDKTKFVNRYSDLRKNEIKNIDLAILAEKISSQENIDYKEAVKKAKKLLENK